MKKIYGIVKGGIMENKRRYTAGGDMHVPFMPRKGGSYAYFIRVYGKR
jgi:hypothetical protein